MDEREIIKMLKKRLSVSIDYLDSSNIKISLQFDGTIFSDSEVDIPNSFNKGE